MCACADMEVWRWRFANYFCTFCFPRLRNAEWGQIFVRWSGVFVWMVGRIRTPEPVPGERWVRHVKESGTFKNYFQKRECRWLWWGRCRVMEEKPVVMAMIVMILAIEEIMVMISIPSEGDDDDDYYCCWSNFKIDGDDQYDDCGNYKNNNYSHD